MKKLLLVSWGLLVGGSVQAIPYPIAVPAWPAQIDLVGGTATELVANGGFEENTVMAGRADYSYWRQGASTANWMGPTENIADFGAGIQKNVGDHPWCDYICTGAHCVFIQKGGAVWQTVTIPKDGFYRLTLNYAARPKYAGHEITAYLDDRSLGGVMTTSSRWRMLEVVFRAAAGEHVLKIQGTDPGADKATTIDQVSLKAARLPVIGNFVANPDFETGTELAGGWKYFQTETTVNYDQASYATTSAWEAAGDAGITMDGDRTWAESTFGTAALFLQRNASASQTITLPADGTYRLAFRAAGRLSHTGHTVQAQIDGVTIGEVYTDGLDWQVFETDFTATAGEHRLSMVGVQNGDLDTSSAVDDIVVALADVVTDGMAHVDTLARGIEYGPDDLSALTIVADADVEQSFDLGAFAGTVTVENTTPGTVIAFPATLSSASLLLKSPATLKLSLGTIAGTQPVLNAITELPASGEIPIQLLCTADSEIGTYVLATSPLAAELATRLVPTVSGGAGRLDLFDGRLVLVLQAFQYMLWRGTAHDTWSSSAWLLNGTGEPTSFVDGMQAMFDGEAQLQTVWVDQDVQVRGLTLTDGSYTFAGQGKISTPSVTQDGAGTFTTLAAGFKDVTAFAVNAGTMRLGADATTGAAGAPGSTVTVKNGARFDLNYALEDGNVGNTAPGQARSAITQLATFNIEGAGPDGNGALYNSYAASNWGFHLGEVVMTGDATIGSLGRIDLRPSVDLGRGRATLTGTDDMTLTLKTSEPTGEMGFNCIDADLSVGRIDLPPEGSLVFENGCNVTVPNGIHLLGGRLGFWGSATPGVHAEVFVDQDSVTFGSGTSYIRAPVTVAENVTWTHVSGNLFQETAAVTNNGTIRVKGGVFDLRPTEYVGAEGTTIELETGDLRVFPYGVQGQVTVNQADGTSHFNNWADWSQAGFTLNMAKGRLYWGSGDSTPPVVDFDRIDFHVEGGEVIFDTQESYVIPDTFSGTAFSMVSFHASQPGNVYTMGDFAWTIPNLRLGANARYGILDLEPGAELTVADLRLGCYNASPASTRLTVKTGSTLLATNVVKIGEWSGSSTATHELLVAGGEFTSTAPVEVGFDSPFAYLTIKDGVVDVPSLNPRSRLDYMSGFGQDTLTHEEVVRQEGGLLKVGDGGLKDLGTPNNTPSHVEHNLPNYVFQSGELQAKASFETGFGAAVLFGTKPTAAGEVPFTLNDAGQTVTFKTGLAGAANVTLAGDGLFVSDPDLQGIPEGTWHVNKASADLRGASGFAGGLELETGAYAQVANVTTNLVEFGLFNLHTKDLATNDFWNCRLQMLNTGMELLHNWRLNGQRAYHTYAYQGEFYVAPDQAGLWSFAGNFDDEIYLEIDGQQIVYGTSWEQVNRGSATLAAGWHAFKAYGFDGSGEAGPQYRQKEWNSTTTGLGFRIGSEGGLAAADYTRFDPANLPMRPTSSLRLRRATGKTAEDLMTNEEWDESRITYVAPNRLMPQNVLRAARQALTSSSGSFLVEPERAGTWTFTGGCDDNVGLVIDGTEVLRTTGWQNVQTGSIELTPGWHTVDIRTFDGTGGWGGMINDANGVRCVLKVQLPGMESADEAIAFQNPAFRFAPTADGSDVRPGLGGVSKIAADAILENTGTAVYPIYGTVSGAGQLSGAFRFVGEANRLSVAGTGTSSKVDVVTFQNPDALALKELGGVKAVFENRPANPKYVLSDAALGLTDERAITLPVDVRDAAGNDYSENFAVRVQGGRVVLTNSKAVGLFLIIK